MTIRIIQGDVRQELPKLPADFFDCIVTSPPYFGLRDYGTATWEGGDVSCEHKVRINRFVATSTLGGGKGSVSHAHEGFSEKCQRCGAIRIDAQIGLEPTLDAYLETMVAVCRELRRVLKPSGVFFLNIGDSYATGTSAPRKPTTTRGPHVPASWARRSQPERCGTPHGLKTKDLMLVPERLGIMLQTDGWYVRSHIIWAKKNPMPESVTDRPTSAHETIWILTKSARYYWDAEAVREDVKDTSGVGMRAPKLDGGSGERAKNGPTAQERKTYSEIKGANCRNVWFIASQPFPGAHFATMPAKIAERCIKAGSSERGCCPTCGAPLVRVVERSREVKSERAAPSNTGNGINRNRQFHDGFPLSESKTLDWQQSCKCSPADQVPARILDPFGGSGTTGLVADRLGRNATLIDLNTKYMDMARDRIVDDAPLFVEIAAQ